MNPESCQRALVGVDARRARRRPAAPGNTGFRHLDEHLLKNATFPASIDRTAWPPCAGLALLRRQANQALLFDTAFRAVAAFARREGGMLVGFDLPLEEAQWYAEHRDLRPLPLDTVDGAPGWRFLGFDIAEQELCGSAIYGFGWEVGELEKVLAGINCPGWNSHGLIDEPHHAQALAQWCSEDIPAHAPFTPCGVWVWDFDKGGGPPVSPWEFYAE